MLVNCFRTSYTGDRNNTQAGYTCHKKKTSCKHSTSIQPKPCHSPEPSLQKDERNCNTCLTSIRGN